MSTFCCVVAVIVTIFHVVNAGSLTRQCHASNGTCAKRGNTCETAFGSKWTNIGKCCRGGPCCKFQCEDLKPQPNGIVFVSGRDIGDVANFSCKSGYTLLGSQSLRCTDSGWDGDIPICYDCPGNTLITFNDKIYSVLCTITNNQMASFLCAQRGLTLLSVETREENIFMKRIASLIEGQADWWIALSDVNTEGTFVWVSGQPLNYTDWYQGTPTQPDDRGQFGVGPAHCAALVNSYQYQWGDEHCSHHKRIICESWVSSQFIHDYNKSNATTCTLINLSQTDVDATLKEFNKNISM